MNPTIPKDIVKKVRKFIETAEALKNGQATYFSITRLTSIKGLCGAPRTAVLFTHYLAERTLEQAESKPCPSHIVREDWVRYKALMTASVHAMRRHLEESTDATLSELRKLRPEVKAVQTYSGKQVWGRVMRTIQSRDVLIIEDALDCILYPHAAAELAYKAARDYSERYNAHYGTGLIPESVPMLEDIIQFWKSCGLAEREEPPHSLGEALGGERKPEKRRRAARVPRQSATLRVSKATTTGSFEATYPNITNWVRYGWIEIGSTEGSRSFIRVLDEGGVVWEGKNNYLNMAEALQDAEKGIRAWQAENA